MKAIMLALVLVYGSAYWFLGNPHSIFGMPTRPVEEAEAYYEPVTYSPPSLEEVLGDAAQRHGIPVRLLRAVARIESNEDETNSAVRREPHLVAKHGEANAKSYGVMQIMGFHARKTCGVDSWAELVGRKNIDANVDCGALILRQCLTWAMEGKAKGKSKTELFRAALGCYNGDGSGAYANKVLLAMSEIALESSPS